METLEAYLLQMNEEFLEFMREKKIPKCRTLIF